MILLSPTWEAGRGRGCPLAWWAAEGPGVPCEVPSVREHSVSEGQLVVTRGGHNTHHPEQSQFVSVGVLIEGSGTTMFLAQGFLQFFA